MKSNTYITFTSVGVLLTAFLVGTGFQTEKKKTEDPATGFVGSESCKDCHERFYHLWEPSHHGKAMQPYNDAFAAANLKTHSEDVEIEGKLYRAHVGQGEGWIMETDGEAKKKFPITLVMGGKNVFFLLTPMERGRLQVLPLSFDTETKMWYNTTKSMLRHFGEQEDQEIAWKDPLLTFNTSCHGCHVSQMTNNYDAETDSYDTTWREPGINCEACHGPGGEHNRVCREAPEGTVPKELKLILWGDLNREQGNSACAACHAKFRFLSASFETGQRFFDHFDLVCLEDPDFYPDGRDLGENYTYTTWLMSDCAEKSQMDCVRCHTSSGRYRFKGEKTNDACLPCHKARVDNPTPHTHHKKGKGNQCVSCHMPMTTFAQMRRSDHSMRPPMPELSKRFKSPDACTICHEDKDVDWAIEKVRKWHPDSKRVKEEIHRAELVEAARKGDTSRDKDILAYLARPKINQVFAASLLRLLNTSRPNEKRDAILRDLAAQSPSPLVRSAAVAQITPQYSLENLNAILKATGDSYLATRFQAGQRLGAIPQEMLPPDQRQSAQKAVGEARTAMTSRLDQWSTHYNIGNFLMDERRFGDAAKAYDKASGMRADIVPPLLNASMAYVQIGDFETAEKRLRQALLLSNNREAVHFNLGLLLSETGRKPEARKELEAALRANPKFAQASYNLGILLLETDPARGFDFLRKAAEDDPENSRYRYAHAFYLNQAGKSAEAEKVLRNAVADGIATEDIYMMLIELLDRAGRTQEANEIRALARKALAPGQ